MARTETHFIWTGDYVERLDRLLRAAEAAKDDKAPLLGGEEHPYDVLKAEYEALRAEADQNGQRVVVRGLDDAEWDELADAHPPRTDEAFAEKDAALGFNERAGMRPLIYAALVEPKFDSRAKFDEWVRSLGMTRGDLIALGMRAWRLTNEVDVLDPKSLRALPSRDAEQS